MQVINVRYFLICLPVLYQFSRVATAQGKQGIWLLIFQTGKQENLGTTQGQFGQCREFPKFL